jgi:hypothetical protein
MSETPRIRVLSKRAMEGFTHDHDKKATAGTGQVGTR